MKTFFDMPLRRTVLPLILLSALVSAAPPAPSVWWSIDEEAQQFTSRLPAGKDETPAAGTIRSFENRPGWCPAPKTACETQAVGDGWDKISVLADVYVRTTTGNYQGVVCRDRWGGATGDVFALLITPKGKWMGRIRTSTGQCTVETEALPGWHLLALVYDGNSVQLSVDGRPAASAKCTGNLVREPDTPLAFGRYSGSADGLFKGALHDVKIWSDSLDDATLSSLCQIWKSDVASTRGEGFWFGEAADTHITDTKSVEIVNDAVDQLNADSRLDFTLWLGDLTRGAAPDEMALARMALSRLQKPYYVLRGNHDQHGDAYGKEFGSLRQRFDHGGWVFLLIDSNPGDNTPISEVDRTWVVEQLKSIEPDVPIILCTHHPLMPHTKAYRIAGADDFLALFKGHNLKACLSGHYHGNQEEIINGILFTTTACLSTTRNNFDGSVDKGYRLFHCRKDTITTEFVSVRPE